MSITATHARPQPSAMRFFATFGYAWFTIGLFTGTLVLVVAVRGILDVLHRLGWEQAAQNRLLIVVILLFVVGSFLLARRVVRSVYRQSPTTRKMILFALAIPAVLSGYAWSNPTRFLAGFAGTEGSSLAMKGGPKFLFGSYPDEDRLRQLKKEGVTAVVSLQSPSVLVEISGISEERTATSREGLKFIEAPMLPWVSDNTESLEKVKQLALHGKGIYYVHCGLGRDRVNIVKRVIESLQPQTGAMLAAASDLKRAAGFEQRTEAFERGWLMKVSDGVWVVPYPNKEEFHGFIIQGQPGHVILALDPRDALQRAWIADAESKMAQYAVPYSLIPYPAANGDTSTAAVLAQMRALKPPYTVLVPKTGWVVGLPDTPVPRAIAKAYKLTLQPPPKAVPKTEGETPHLVPGTIAAPAGTPVKKAE